MKRLRSYHTKGEIEAGCDEAGRGCLAGPVVAAAVILPPKIRLKGLNDSKQLNQNLREKLRPQIEAKAISWAVVFVDPGEIDRVNILQASILAMKRAVDRLAVRPTSLLIDGKFFVPHEHIAHHCIVKGDSKYRSIAAASILAKTYRDEFMEKQHEQYPQYHWDHNKGYPTKEHRKAIFDLGPCELHRKSFKLFPYPEQLSLFE